MNSVACPSTGRCTAVDYSGREVTFDPTAPGTPTPVAVDSANYLTSIACSSTGQCTAVDTSGREVTFDPGTPGTPTPVAISGANSLSAIACASLSSCVAVDSVGYGFAESVPPPTTISTTASGPITVGAKVNDTATLAGGSSPTGTITFKLYGPGNASCANPPAYTSPTVAVSGNGEYESPEFTPTEAGTYRWIASYSGDADNEAAAGACGDSEESVTVAKGDQTITFNAPSGVTYGDADSDLTASSDSGLPVTIASETQSVCTVAAGPKLHVEAAGECKLTASQAGNDNYNAATPVEQHFQVAKKGQTISFDAPADRVVGAPDFDPGATTTSPLAIAYSSQSIGVCTIVSNQVHIVGAGECKVTAEQAGDGNYEAATPVQRHFQVATAHPTLATHASDAALGSPIRDTALVFGRQLPLAGATLDFKLYGPGDETCSEAPVFEDLAVEYPVAGGQVPSAGFTPTEVGTYRWIVRYSGDADNIGAVGSCNDAGESSTVTASPFAAPSETEVGEEPDGMASGDLDGDGILDLVTANRGSDDVTVLFGDGNGGFGRQQTIPVGEEPSSVQIGDVTGDGIPDIVVTDAGSDEVTILPGDGHGGFGSPISIPVGEEPTSVALGDLDGDGHLDIVTANRGSEDVTVLISDGHGGFEAPLTLPAGTDPSSVTIADLDGDGNLDLIVSNAGSGDVSVLHGDGQGGFSAPMDVPVGTGPAAVLVGDFNGDGRADLVTANGAGTISAVFARGATALKGGASPDVVLGGQLSDTATLSGGVRPSGAIAFRAYGPDDASCTGAPAFTDTVAVGGNGQYRSAAFTPTQPGTYRWVASYAGDESNDPVAGACNEPGQSATVAPKPTELTPCPKIHTRVTNYTPLRSHGSGAARGRATYGAIVTGVRARLEVNAPALQAVHATVTYELDGRKHVAVLHPRTLSNAHTRNVHLPFPRPLRHRLALGTRVTVKLRISSMPRSKACTKATVTTAELTAPVVKVLAEPQHRAK